MGDKVLLSTKNLPVAGPKKLKQRWVGPFKVVERMGRTAYKLEMQGRFLGVHPVFHVSQVKPHTPGGASATPPAPVEVDGEEQYEVEALLAHRARGK